MNILIFSWRGPGHPNAGGAEISTHQHAKGWVQNGHKVTLFTSYYKGGKSEEVIDGVNIIRRGDQFFSVHLEAFKWYMWGIHQDFEIVVDEFHGIPFFTPLYIRTKKIGFIHEVAKEVWKLNFNLVLATLGGLLEPLIFQLYKKNYFMTVSQSTKRDLVKWGIPQSRIEVIHNGINAPLFSTLPSKEKRKTLIYMGTLAKDKGIEDALLIFSKISFIKDWQFWIVGKGSLEYLEKLKVQSQRLGLKGKVKFWGFVDEKKKNELLAKAHIVVNPSIREGWGLVVIEAAAVGTPTIAFNVPGLRDSIVNGRTGILSDRHTIESITDDIVELLEDNKRYDRICRNAITWSKNFSWPKAVKSSLDLINRVYRLKIT